LLFFEAGLLKLKCHIIDALHKWRTVSELYPKTITIFLVSIGKRLVNNLMEQISNFNQQPNDYQVIKLEDGILWY
jgi:hypothetical protein